LVGDFLVGDETAVPKHKCLKHGFVYVMKFELRLSVCVLHDVLQ